jgi:hypothetical protein
MYASVHPLLDDNIGLLVDHVYRNGRELIPETENEEGA